MLSWGVFANPEYLYLLLFVPLFFVLFILRLRADRRRLKNYMQTSCLKTALGSSFYQNRVIRHSLLLALFLFLILGLARPRSTKEVKEVTVGGGEVMILADVSNSMLVEDVSGFSRLDVMKKELDKLITRLAGHRVGLISFAGSSLLVSPLTLDHLALKLFVKSLVPGQHSVQGTDLNGALLSAKRAFKRGGVQAPNTEQVLIIVSDGGEQNEKPILESIEGMENTQIIALGVGTSLGGMIPLYNEKGKKVGYKKDRKGEPVVSRFNEGVLKKMALVSKGVFYTLSPGGGAVEKISIQAKGESKQTQNVYKELYQYFVFMAFCFGLLWGVPFFIFLQKQDYRL